MLKDGRTSAVNLPARTTKTDELVTRMTGRKIEYVFPAINQIHRPNPFASKLRILVLIVSPSVGGGQRRL